MGSQWTDEDDIRSWDLFTLVSVIVNKWAF